MKKIVITGSIGSGKSFVCELLRQQGKYVLDLDEVAKEVRNTTAKQEIIETFGQSIVFDDEIDPNRLRDVVFHDKNKLKQLERIIHPYVLQMMLKVFKESKIDVFVEMALLYEAGWQAYFDEIWLVECKEEVALKRLVEYRGYSHEDAKKILQHQKRKRIDYSDVKHVIINDGNEEDVEKQLKLLL